MAICNQQLSLFCKMWPQCRKTIAESRMHKFAARREGRNGANANLIMQPSKVEQLSNNEGSEGHGSSAGRMRDQRGEAAEKKNQSFIPSGGGGGVLTFLPCKCSDGDASMSVCACHRTPHSILMRSLDLQQRLFTFGKSIIYSFLSMK